MNLRLPRPFAIFGMLLALGCGKERGGNARSEDGGAGGMPASETDPCDVANAFRIWGKTYDFERDCIDTEHQVEDVACSLPAEAGEDPYYSDGFSCLESKLDGSRVWVFAYYRLGFNSSMWARCPDAPLIAPKGCYAADCATAPRSTCSLADTRLAFACGPTSEYDEQCCARPDCKTDADCGDGEACVSFRTLGQWYCWDNPGNSCDCGGPLGGAPRLKCIAK